MSAELFAEDEHVRPPWELGRVVGDKYRLTRMLGMGGMGAVYAAEQTGLGREVAIKALRGESEQVRRATSRLLREARTVARLAHPNIVDVFDVGVDEDVPYLVMELLHGEALSDRLARGRIPLEDLGVILLPAMRGVAAAHAAGVVHRDLKPDNLFLGLTDTGGLSRVLVLDFGISVDTEHELLDTRLTRSGTIVGTPRYMAPEQLAGEPIDERTDVYAFGAILYEMVTGLVPVDGDTFALLAAAKLSSRPEPPSTHRPEIGSRLEALILRTLERDPSRRPASIDAFAAELADALTNPGPPPSVQRASSGRAPLWLGLGFAALVVIGLVIGGLMWWWSDDATTPPAVAEPTTATPPAEPPTPSEPEPEPATPEPLAPVAEVEPPPSEPPAPAPEAVETETESEPTPTISRRSGRRRGPARTGRLTWDDF